MLAHSAKLCICRVFCLTLRTSYNTTHNIGFSIKSNSIITILYETTCILTFQNSIIFYNKLEVKNSNTNFQTPKNLVEIWMLHNKHYSYNLSSLCVLDMKERVLSKYLCKTPNPVFCFFCPFSM